MSVSMSTANQLGQPRNKQSGKMYIAKLSEIQGFNLKPITSQGEQWWAFECAGIATHVRPLQFNQGLEVKFPEIGSPISATMYVIQPEKGKLFVELVTALAEMSCKYHRERTLKLAGMKRLI